MGKIEVSGELLIFKKGHTPNFVFETIQKRNLKGLRIFADLDSVPDASFLRDYSFLEALDVTSRDDYDYSFLKELVNLKKLSIYTVGKNEIDLSSQTNLEYLVIQWRKGKIRGLEHCQKLETLSLVEYKEVDFLPIVCLRLLKHLRVKTASVKTLSGLNEIEFLESILLGYCPSLRSIKAINGLKQLKSLEIDLCTKIDNYESLTDLPNLEYLRIANCKGIKSIDFIENFPSLNRLALVGNTNILDGNMMPTQRIKEVFYAPRRLYNT